MARVTLKQIAQKTGLSQPTVSHVLNERGNYRDRTKKLVLAAASELGYKPNLAALAMRTGKTKAVGVLTRNEPGHKLFQYLPAYEFLLGINDRLDAEGYVLCLVRIGDVRDGSRSRVFEEHAVDGIILIDVLPDDVSRRVDDEFNESCIWLDNNVWRDAGCIRRDEEAVGRTLALKAAEKGYRSIVWYSSDLDSICEGSPRHYSTGARRRGVLEGARQAGLEVHEFTSELREDAEAGGDQLASLITSDTAVITHAPSFACWTRDVMELRGMLAGVHYGLACCDGDHYLEDTWPALTRMAYARYDMGREAASMLLGRLESPNEPCRSRLVLPGEFEEGSTLPGPQMES